jgi:hypothetical protein
MGRRRAAGYWLPGRGAADIANGKIAIEYARREPGVVAADKERTDMMSRRTLISGGLAFAGLTLAGGRAHAAAKPTVTVHRSPT